MPRIEKLSLAGLLVAFLGCAANTDSPKKESDNTSPDAAEKLVRVVIAKLMKVDESTLPMDRPISDPPIKADELDLVEIVLDLEERAGVEITDAAIQRYLGGKIGAGPPRITPNQLAKIVREAPKLQPSKRKK